MTLDTQFPPASDDGLDHDRLAEDLRDRLMRGGTYGDWLGASQADLEAMYIVGWRLYKLGKYKEAAIALRKLVTMAPYERRYLQALGNALQMMGSHAEAVGFYHMLFVLDAEDPMPTFYMAQCLLHMGQSQDAADVLEATIDNASNKPEFAALREQALAMQTLIRQNANPVVETP
jgi:type III secretion system low calcium response chaperone LcrH/SycD